MALVNPSLTLPKSYIAFDSEKTPTTTYFIIVSDILKFLEERNYVCEPALVTALLQMNSEELNELFKYFEKEYTKKSGTFFRNSFATKDSAIDEKMTFDEFIFKITQYFIVYGLGETPKGIKNLVKNNKRKVSKELNVKSETFKDMNKVLKVLRLKTFKEFEENVKKIVQMPIVFGETEYNFINAVAVEHPDIVLEYVKDGLNVKENLFNIMDAFTAETIKENQLLKTVTDVLRYALYINKFPTSYFNCDIFKNCKFKTSEKRYIISVINEIGEKSYNEVYGEMKSKRDFWLIIGKTLYIGSKKFKKFTIAQNLFNDLRDKKKIQYFNSTKESYIKDKKIKKLINLLMKRPGILMRHLDFIIRNSKMTDIDYLSEELIKNGSKLNMKLVMQMYTYIQFRIENDIKERIFKLQNNINYKTDEKPLIALDKEKGNKIQNALDNILRNHLKGKKLFKDNVSSIYFDESLKNYIMPTEMRDNSIVSDGSRFTTGTRIPLPKEIKSIRLYTAWGTKEDFQGEKDDNGNFNYDIDLSASAITKENIIEPLSFYSENSDFGSHSGDWVYCEKWDKKNVVAEFIDIDIEVARKKYDYIYTINNLFGSPGAMDFDTDVNVQSGIMFLDKYRQAKKQKIDITNSFWSFTLRGKYQAHLPIMIDLERMEIVIMDTYFKTNNGSTLHSLQKDINTFKIMYSNAYLYKENVQDMLSRYSEENGIEIAKDIDNADLAITTFDMKDKNFFNVGKELDKIIGLLS